MYDAFISEHTGFFADVATAATIVEKEETMLRELTLEAYKLTGNKQPVPGVGIRETTKLEYDPKVALNWGIEHHGIALKLDTKAFETVVKATPSIVDFVTSRTEVTATIAKELEVTTPE